MLKYNYDISTEEVNADERAGLEADFISRTGECTPWDFWQTNRLGSSSHNLNGVKSMDEIIGTIKMFAGTFAPQGFYECTGGLLPIRNNEVLFSILSTSYGGDGMQTFQLPDLRPVDEAGVKREWLPNEPRYIICSQGVYPQRP
jgi:hypothetical protein